MATRGLQVVQVLPIGLSPFDPLMRSHHGALGQPLATGLQIGTLGELGKLSQQGEEARTPCAHARRKTRTPAHARIMHTRTRTRIHAHTHAHTRTREVCVT